MSSRSNYKSRISVSLSRTPVSKRTRLRKEYNRRQKEIQERQEAEERARKLAIERQIRFRRNLLSRIEQRNRLVKAREKALISAHPNKSRSKSKSRSKGASKPPHVPFINKARISMSESSLPNYAKNRLLKVNIPLNTSKYARSLSNGKDVLNYYFFMEIIKNVFSKIEKLKKTRRYFFDKNFEKQVKQLHSILQGTYSEIFYQNFGAIPENNERFFDFITNGKTDDPELHDIYILFKLFKPTNFVTLYQILNNPTNEQIKLFSDITLSFFIRSHSSILLNTTHKISNISKQKYKPYEGTITKQNVNLVRNKNSFQQRYRPFIQQLIENKSKSKQTQNTYIIKFLEDIIRYTKYKQYQNPDDVNRLSIILDFYNRFKLLTTLSGYSSLLEKIMSISQIPDHVLK